MRYANFAAAAALTAIAVSAHAQVIHNLPVSDVALVKNDAASGRVTGVLTNTSGRKLESVVVQFAILDPEGTQIATAQAAAMGLADGKKWRFEAPFIGTTGSAVASVNLANVMAGPAQ